MHERWCQSQDHDDAAKRLSDTYNLHRIGASDYAIGKWFAASLSEGRSDDVLYDSKRDAVRGQKHNEQYYTFIKIIPTGMNECEAAVMLKMARKLYDNGMRLADPEHRTGGLDVIKRVSIEDMLAAAEGMPTNLTFPRKGY
jgi:hypothetical protein